MAPAKVNLNLLVGRREPSGLHAIESLVQTVEWCDVLTIDEAESDDLVVRGIEVPEGPDNIVVTAIEALRARAAVPPVRIELDKAIPAEAGLGGGSADAAAALVAGAELARAEPTLVAEVAADVGADVSFPLIGGSAEMSGFGERIRPLDPLGGFALAIVVPEFGLRTSQVYERWDALGGPTGFEIPDRFLPPTLRGGRPIRNDLYRAAVDIEPALGDFVAETGRVWDGAVLMTGSGSACFGFFGTREEADEAASAVPATRAAIGVDLRSTGVERLEEP